MGAPNPLREEDRDAEDEEPEDAICVYSKLWDEAGQGKLGRFYRPPMSNPNTNGYLPIQNTERRYAKAPCKQIENG